MKPQYRDAARSAHLIGSPYCETTTLGEVHMSKIVLDIQSDGVAVILTSEDAAGGKRLATLYRMKDGWHTKLATEHTRHAWSGPFASAEDAFEAFKVSASTPA